MTSQDPKKPSIGELKDLLTPESTNPVEILPDGTIKKKPTYEQLEAEISALKAEVEVLKKELARGYGS
jgi:hypothetical protein